MAYSRDIISGAPGLVWVNNTTRAKYQFFARLKRTCGVCIQYHLKISDRWPIPFHDGCTCYQVVILPGKPAPEGFCDYRKLLDGADWDQKVSCIGAANYRLLEHGLVDWQDIVQHDRIRTLTEVVVRRKIKPEQMKLAGIPQRTIDFVEGRLHTPEAQLVEERRKQLINNLKGVGLTDKDIASYAGAKLAQRVSIAPGGVGTASSIHVNVKPPTGNAAGPWPDLNKLTFVKQLGGSTGAELVEDANGNRYVRKQGANADHLREEFAADEIYRKLGVPVPEGKLYDTPQGPVKLTKFIAGQSLAELQKSDPAAFEKAIKQARQHFAADALLGNWDVVGLNLDNMLVDAKGTVYRIDNGGALRYRAQGALKTPTQFGGDVGELMSMRNPGANASAGAVFGGLTDAQLRKQCKALVGKAADILDASPPALRPILRKRLDYLDAYAKVVPPKPSKQAQFKPLPAKQFRTFKTADQADKHFTGLYDNWAKSMTKDEREAIQEYKNSTEDINGHLREPANYPASPLVKKQIRELDAVLARNPLPESVTAVRYFYLKDVGLKRADIKPGVRIVEKGFVSTSVNPHHTWSGDRFEIRVPKGTPAGYIQIATPTHQDEFELLLGRNQTLRVVELRHDAAQTIVLELVPPKPKPAKKP